MKRIVAWLFVLLIVPVGLLAAVFCTPVQYDATFLGALRDKCALLAKGRLIPVQLKALFEGGDDSLYYELGKRENELALKLAKGVVDAGHELWLPHQTNQVFIILDNEKIEELNKDFLFYTWCPYDEGRSVIRLVTSWGTTEEDIDAILAALQK